jgi:hypothetical protein
MNGQIVLKQLLNKPVGQVIIDAAAFKGIYVVSVVDAQMLPVSRKVVL